MGVSLNSRLESTPEEEKEGWGSHQAPLEGLHRLPHLHPRKSVNQLLLSQLQGYFAHKNYRGTSLIRNHYRGTSLITNRFHLEFYSSMLPLEPYPWNPSVAYPPPAAPFIPAKESITGLQGIIGVPRSYETACSSQGYLAHKNPSSHYRGTSLIRNRLLITGVPRSSATAFPRTLQYHMPGALWRS